ncbi:uncharacterized protein LOC143610053 [Bidens hawaiensis]|uniref:uncharacterized protein LOC143610053 n=1 Tax=Bidens hawaiensis TaxID=980011 RepID=UPI00404A94A8
MRFFKRIVGYLGFGNHEVNKDSEDDDNNNNHNVNAHNHPNSVDQDHSHLPRRGFSVSVQVPVDKSHQIGPVLVPCPAGDGGVQGLQWYTRGLKIDEDGDVADEFLEEVFSETAENEVKTWSTFEVKLTAKPAKARNPCLSREGTVQHTVKYHGRLQLIG